MKSYNDLKVEMEAIQHQMVGARASDIAKYLKAKLTGEDMYINSASSLFSPKK